MKNRYFNFVALLLAICSALYLGEIVNAEEYRLSQGDIISVTVVDHQDLGGSVTIMADGTVFLPIVGQCEIAGLSLSEAMAKLRGAYAKRLINPEVYLALTSTHAASVYILGAVKTPGIYPLKNKMGALDLLLAANGLTQHPEMSRATLLHRSSKESATIVLTDLLKGVPQANIALTDGDLLLVETRPNFAVYISGDVEAPGIYDLPEGSTLTQAITSAHGVHGDIKDKQITLFRGKEVFPVHLYKLYQADTKTDLPLQKGDILRVDSALISVNITGEVIHPGEYSVLSDLPSAELLKLAGGTTAAANLTDVVITHRDGSQVTVNMNNKLPDDPVRLQSGDRVNVSAITVSVDISGEVKLPGKYNFSPKQSLTEAIALAGGPTREAELGSVRVLHRDGSVNIIDANQQEGLTSLNLAEGDRVVVPSATAQVAVLGAIKNPGYYSIDTKRPYKVSEAIIRAGGLAERSNPGNITVTRLVDGLTQKIEIKFDNGLRSRNANGDLPLLQGDIVYVPKSNSWTFSDIVGSVSLFALLRSLTR